MAELAYYLGDCLARLDRYAEAERFFKEEVALYPNNLRAHAGLAMMYQASGKTQMAEQAIGRMLATVPTLSAYRQAANLWRLFGRSDGQAEVLAANRFLVRQ